MKKSTKSVANGNTAPACAIPPHIKRQTQIVLVSDLLERALRGTMDAMVYQLGLIKEAGILDFNGLLAGHAARLNSRANELQANLSSVLPKECVIYEPRENEGLADEVAFYRRALMRLMKDPESAAAAEAVFADLFQLYGEVEIFMRAICSFDSDGMPQRETCAPQFTPNPYGSVAGA